MKRKVVALGLAVVLSLSLSMTAFAASSTTENNSGTGSYGNGSESSSEESSSSESSTVVAKPAEKTVQNALPGGAVASKTVTVAVKNANGTVTATSLEQVLKNTVATIRSAAVTPGNAAAAVQSLMTAPASPFFMQTVAALEAVKGSAMNIHPVATVKTAAVAKDAFGNTIAAAGVIKNVTPQALVMLVSVNADGTMEYVEGVVDPITGLVIGAFQGVPTVITVMVLA